MSKIQMLILSVAGIGNTILQTPLINVLLASGKYEIDILFGDIGMRAVYEYDNRIRTKFVVPNSFIGKIKLLRVLRNNHYDNSIACFPSNRFEYNIVPWLLGIKRRIIHRYNMYSLRSLSFLSNCKVDVNEDLHDVEQNLNLLRPFGIDPSVEYKQVSFSLSHENEDFAEAFIRNFDQRSIVGIHPSETRFLPERGWLQGRFLQVIESIKPFVNIVLVGTANDLDPFYSVEGVNLCITSLNNAAAVIKRCHLFVSVDTGLMHVAAVFGIRQIVLWGPARFSRTHPRSSNVVFLGRTDLQILHYPFSDTRSIYHHPNPQQFMSEIPAEQVIKAIRDAIKFGEPYAAPNRL